MGGPAARLRRIRKGGRQAAGAEHLSGKCDSERKDETKLMAPTYVFSPQEMGGQVDVRGRRMEGHGIVSQGVGAGRGRDWTAALALPRL